MTDDNSPIDIPRRRKTSASALASREAAALVRPLNQQLGLWQASSVKLRTIAERLSASGRSDPTVAEETRALFQLVSAEAERFERLLPSQPDAVLQHSRIKDTLRSFEMVSDRLRVSLTLLGEPSQGQSAEGE